jgi:NTP pyrophosphatase (non-canonical NTP hydrolase)
MYADERVEFLYAERAMSNDFTFDKYQAAAAQTAMYPGRGGDTIAPYPALGLAGEAGEVCEHIKKAIRDDGGQISAERCSALKKELGDVMWYLAELCSELNLEMGDVAETNVAKLADRKRRGVIHGSGDNR